MTLPEDRVQELFARLQKIEERPIYISDLKFGSFLGGVKFIFALLISCIAFGWTAHTAVGSIPDDLANVSKRMELMDGRLQKVEFIITHIKKDCIIPEQKK